MKARWANAARIERIPRITALAEPFGFFAGRPATQRAADAWGFRFAGLLLLLNLAIWKYDRIASDWTHARYYDRTICLLREVV